MFRIKTFNAIAQAGLQRFDQENYLVDETADYEGVLLRSQDLHETDLSKNLLGIARAGAGTNNIPVNHCTEKGIVVFNTPGANANAVKELVLASLLLSVRPILKGAAWMQTLEGSDISKQVEANKKQFAGTELEGKKLGVIGLGAIGALIANDAYRLGMEVIGYDPYVSVDTAWTISRRVKRAADLAEVFATCDFITIHVPLMEHTKKLIGKEELAAMKPTTQLFNFSRGEIVDNTALLHALKKEEIAGFTTDFADEKLLRHDKITVLPHLGASTQEAEINCAKMAAQTLKEFLEEGTIKRSVNFPEVEMAFRSPYRLTIINRNVPNMLGQISSAIAEEKINIDNMVNRGRGDFAYTLVDVAAAEEEKLQQVLNRLSEMPDIIRTRFIKNQKEAY